MTQGSRPARPRVPLGLEDRGSATVQMAATGHLLAKCMLIRCVSVGASRRRDTPQDCRWLDRALVSILPVWMVKTLIITDHNRS